MSETCPKCDREMNRHVTATAEGDIDIRVTCVGCPHGYRVTKAA